eukprot:jgi/Hompol1/2178/HPOL_001436-RA
MSSEFINMRDLVKKSGSIEELRKKLERDMEQLDQLSVTNSSNNTAPGSKTHTASNTMDNISSFVSATENEPEPQQSEGSMQVGAQIQPQQQQQPVKSVSPIHTASLSEKEVTNKSPKATTRTRILPEQRESFAVASVVTGTKVKKLQISTAHGAHVMDVNLKRWDEKRVQITDMRPNIDAKVLDVVAVTDRNGKPIVAGNKATANLKPTDLIFSITSPDQHSSQIRSIGTLEFQSDMKLVLISAEPTSTMSSPATASSITPSGSGGFSAATTPGDPAFQLAITGDFKQGRYIFVKKAAHSREQKLFGETKGRTLVRRTVLESHWLANVDIDATEVRPLVMAAVVVLALIV